MNSSSKQCANCFAVSGKFFPRVKSSSNANPSIFSFFIRRPVFVIGPCMLKWSLLLICSGIISSGFCFYFGHIWRIFLRKNNCWLSRSYSLAKYNSWTCALLVIYTRASPIISSIFLRIFGDMISSIGCGFSVLVSRSYTEDIYARTIWFWFWVSSRTCLVTADELVLSAAKMV